MNINGQTAAIESNSLISNDGTCDIKLNNNTIEMKADSVVMSGDVYGDKFIINNYTGDLGYLMTDGSILTTSQQGQPNIYLYTNSNVITVPPASGQVRSNFPDNTSVTILYISHITSDNVDVEVFLNQISVISIIYMQDKNNSQNYVRFTVTAAPTSFPNSYISVPVLYLDSGGIGDVDLGGGAAIFLSIFDNSPLVDARLSSVETKTQHQTANINETIFNKPILMNNNKISNLGAPTAAADAVTRLYTDTADALKVSRSGDTMTGVLDMGANKISSSYVPLANNDLTNKLYTDTRDALQLNLTGGTLTGTLDMGGNKIMTTYVPLANNDLTNKLYTDSRDALQLNLTGGTLTGALDMGANKITSSYIPLANNDLTNKLYVDNAVGGTGYLPLTGGTMSGSINMGGQQINNSGIISAVGFVKNGGSGGDFLKANGGSDPRIMSNLQALQNNFQVGINGILTETNITANPDAGSYTWADLGIGFARRWRFYAISTRSGSTVYTMRFKSDLGTMSTWVLPALNTPVTNQTIEITMTVSRRLPDTLSFYGKWDSSDTGSNQSFWFQFTGNTNVPGLFNGGNYSVSVQSNNTNANITFQYIEVQNIYNG